MEVYRGNIIMVDFGQNQGCVQSGIRPAVVIQNDVGNKYSTTTIVVPITGKSKKNIPTHHELQSKNYKCLKCNSTILAEQLITISKKQILDVMGNLREEDCIKLNSIISLSINLNKEVS